jgi:hypothetical protein
MVLDSPVSKPQLCFSDDSYTVRVIFYRISPAQAASSFAKTFTVLWKGFENANSDLKKGSCCVCGASGSLPCHYRSREHRPAGCIIPACQDAPTPGGSRACSLTEAAHRSDGAGTGTWGHGCDGHCGGRYTWEPRGMLRRETGGTKKGRIASAQEFRFIHFNI